MKSMELKISKVIPSLTKLMVVALVIGHVKCDLDCKTKTKPISFNFVQEAADLSQALYEKEGNILVKGMKVGKDSEFFVHKIIRKDMKDNSKRMDLFEEPLKAVIANTKLHTLNATMIGFMGTDTYEELVREFLKGITSRERVTFRKKSVKVMKYFWNAFRKLIDDIRDALPFEKLRTENGDRTYIVTGHSFGGALATLFSIYMMDCKKLHPFWENPDSALITFGGPRVGNREFAELHDKLIRADRKLRFVFNDDVVPHIPYIPGIEISDDIKTDKYVHHSREVWIRGMHAKHHGLSLTVCASRDGKECSNKVNFSRKKLNKYISDHSMTNYVDAITTLSKDPTKVDAFRLHQITKCIED